MKSYDHRDLLSSVGVPHSGARCKNHYECQWLQTKNENNKLAHSFLDRIDNSDGARERAYVCVISNIKLPYDAGSITDNPHITTPADVDR